MCDNLKIFVIVYIQYSFKFLLGPHHIFQPVLFFHNQSATYRFNWQEPNILTLKFKFSFHASFSWKWQQNIIQDRKSFITQSKLIF